jgi:hypothetical protein
MIPLMAKAAPGVGFAITVWTTHRHPFLRRAFLQWAVMRFVSRV